MSGEVILKIDLNPFLTIYIGKQWSFNELPQNLNVDCTIYYDETNIQGQKHNMSRDM